MSGTDDDIDGILALFQLYEQKMYHITYAILHDSHLAEDAVMDAFVKMLEHNYRIEDPKSDASKRLVIAVTRSAAIDLYRKNKRVSSIFNFFHIMCRKKNSRPFFIHLQHLIPQDIAVIGVEAGRRLVEEENFGFVEHGAAGRK